MYNIQLKMKNKLLKKFDKNKIIKKAMFKPTIYRLFYIL